MSIFAIISALLLCLVAIRLVDQIFKRQKKVVEEGVVGNNGLITTTGSDQTLI